MNKEVMKQEEDEPTRWKPWVGLTDDEKEHIEISGGKADLTLAEKIEEILKERNT